MARIRSIHPNACRSRKLASVSAEAERLYWRMLTECDDRGRAEDHPQLIWATCVPLVPGANAESVDRWLGELARVGLVVRYSVNGDRFLQVNQWDEYQHPKKPTPSKIPGPESADVVEDRWGTDGTTGGSMVEPGEEGRGEERRGEGEESGAASGARSGEDQPSEPPKRNPLANLLGPYDAVPPPQPDERDAWLEAFLPEIEAAALAEAAEATKSDKPPRTAVNARIRKIAIARWRTYLQGPRPLRGIGERRNRRAELERVRRACESAPPPPVDDDFELAFSEIGNG